MIIELDWAGRGTRSLNYDDQIFFAFADLLIYRAITTRFPSNIVLKKCADPFLLGNALEPSRLLQALA